MRLRALALGALLVLLLAGCGGDGAEEGGGGGTQAAQTQASSGGASSSELRAAVRGNDVAEVRRLLEAGADPNELDPTGESAFLAAAARADDDPELIELLLEHGGDVRATNREGDTALLLAARQGAPAVVGALLEAESPVDHVNQLGWTALHAAIVLGDGSGPYVDVVQRLIDGGADVQAGDTHGITPLVHAQTAEQVEVVRILREAGAG